MPANPKYLSPSGERLLKVSAGILGGYLLTVAAFGVVASFGHRSEVLFTLQYVGFLVWALLLMAALLARKGWRIWLLYLGLTLLCMAIIYFNKG